MPSVVDEMWGIEARNQTLYEENAANRLVPDDRYRLPIAVDDGDFFVDRAHHISSWGVVWSAPVCRY